MKLLLFYVFTYNKVPKIKAVDSARQIYLFSYRNNLVPIECFKNIVYMVTFEAIYVFLITFVTKIQPSLIGL